MGITKTDFMRGMQCKKMLWLDRHKPNLRISPPETKVRLQAGNDFGDAAMGMFGPYEEMTVYRPGTRIPDKQAMIRNTEYALARGVPVICEAAFSNYNNYCAVDILRKTVAGHDICEVKNAPEVHDQFVRDAAFQYYIVTRTGLRVSRVFIVTHGPDEDNPFVPVDVTAETRSLYGWVNDHIWDLNRMWKAKEEPRIELGDRCSSPYDCWYYDYCHGLRKEPEQLDLGL